MAHTRDDLIPPHIALYLVGGTKPGKRSGQAGKVLGIHLKVRLVDGKKEIGLVKVRYLTGTFNTPDSNTLLKIQRELSAWIEKGINGSTLLNLELPKIPSRIEKMWAKHVQTIRQK